MIRLDRIDVTGYRGITKSSMLPFEGKSILLFGENGTGKSSFVDALERLFTGKVSTLEGRMGISTDRHGPNIRAVDAPVISVSFSDGTQFALETAAAKLPTAVRDYLTAAHEPLYVLRRRQILGFIESKPLERYEHLRPFLQLHETEETETALREVSQRADTEKNRATQSLSTVSSALAHVLSIGHYQVPIEEQVVCASLSRRLEAVGIEAIHSLAELVIPSKTIDKKLAGFGDIQRLIALYNAKNRLAEMRSFIGSVNLTSFQSALKTLRSQEAKVAKTFFEDVLQRGLDWIEADWQGVCPLCETPWEKKPRDRDALIRRIRARLEEMRDVVKTRRDVNDLRKISLENLRKIQVSCESLMTEFKALKDINGLDTLEMIVRSLQKLDAFLDMRIDQISIEEFDDAIASWQTASYAERLGEHMMKINIATKSLPSPAEIEPFVGLRSLINRIEELWRQQTEASSTFEMVQRKSNIASTVLRLAEESRKDVVTEIFNQLSNDIQSLYNQATGQVTDEVRGPQQVTDEAKGLHNIRLSLRPEVRGSATYQSDFYDQKGVVPNAYASDAQLDILGLCTFLALRRWHRNQYPAFNLLILDDVLTSIDSEHAVRTAELILKEFADYQIFITTHDRIWYEHLRDIQARCRVRGQFVNKVIHKWTLEDGPDLREPEEERERLEGLLEDGAASQIASEGGRLLEHILQEMRYALSLSVQAKRGERYEIGEIWPAFYATMRKRYTGFYERKKDLLNALDIRWTIRNWVGAHFNTWSNRVSRDDVLEFGQTVCDLFDGVFCKNCRRFIEPSITPAGQLSCRCGHLIYPAPGKKPIKPSRRTDLVHMTQGIFRDSQLDTELYFQWKRAEMAREKS